MAVGKDPNHVAVGNILRAVRWNCTSLVSWTFTPASTATRYFVNIICPSYAIHVQQRAFFFLEVVTNL